ncbi:MAG: 23S rRNA (adenine(2503)-C(2))-methyltransferase RlmN [Candidatus Aminicenantes bacterium]|nr:MAG: 23S rRNA (adenine(2503)-C(2))-methyltransferase RlmN [Candidatus Aminicenantes bacterium]
MKWIYDLSYNQLKKEITALKMKEFAGDQVFQWLYAKNVQDTDRWCNVSKANKKILLEHYDIGLNKILRLDQDHEGTKKILVELRDKHQIEAVLIEEKDHYTFCISTQVGCPLGCKFCATGRMGFTRNLGAGEIISQVLILRKELERQHNQNSKYTGKINIVLMGMGEPLLNYNHLKKALEIIISDKWIGISPRHITLSTAGILEKIRRFEKDFPGIKLGFSLNAPGSYLREQLMPISQQERLDDIIAYFKSTGKKRKHRVTFEYVLMEGINDSRADAQKTAALLKGIPCKINLIPYNECEGIEFKTPDKSRVDEFSDYLYSRGYTVMVRWSKGKEIKSACGQLAVNNEQKAEYRRQKTEIRGNKGACPLDTTENR